MNERILLLFQSTRAVIKAERLLNEKDIFCKVIPVPRHISSECGMALEIYPESAHAIKHVLDENQIAFAVYESGSTA